MLLGYGVVNISCACEFRERSIQLQFASPQQSKPIHESFVATTTTKGHQTVFPIFWAVSCSAILSPVVSYAVFRFGRDSSRILPGSNATWYWGDCRIFLTSTGQTVELHEICSTYQHICGIIPYLIHCELEVIRRSSGLSFLFETRGFSSNLSTALKDN